MLYLQMFPFIGLVIVQENIQSLRCEYFHYLNYLSQYQIYCSAQSLQIRFILFSMRPLFHSLEEDSPCLKVYTGVPGIVFFASFHRSFW